VPQLIGAEIHDITEKLVTHSDREAAIVGHALVDAALEAVIRSRCVTGYEIRLFGPDELLGSYGAKCSIASAFGLLSQQLYDDLKKIGSIRNHFAHSVSNLSFTTLGLRPDIPQSVKALYLPEHYLEIMTRANELSEDGGKIEDDGRLGLVLVNEDRSGLAWAIFEKDDISTIKGRYLVAVKLAWVVLTSISLQTKKRPIGGQPSSSQ
jgi:hypothetical protein